MTNDDQYSKTRKAAVFVLIYRAKTCIREFTMRDAANDYLEASDANRPIQDVHYLPKFGV